MSQSFPATETEVTFEATLSGPVNGEVTVDVTTTAGTLDPTTVTFPAGDTNPQQVILTLDNPTAGDTISVSLSDPLLDGSPCVDLTATGSEDISISDDDGCSDYTLTIDDGDGGHAEGRQLDTALE